MPNEPEPPPGSPLPVEARRRGGMDTLFSAAWFDEDAEGATAPTAVPPPRPPAAPKGPPDPLVIAVAVLSGLGLLGFSCMSLALTGIFAYLTTLPT